MSRTVAARATALTALSLTLALWLGAGCRRNGCVGGDDGVCVPASACPAIRFACTGPPGFVRSPCSEAPEPP